MTFVGAPAIRVIARNTKRLQQGLQLQKDGVLASSKHISQHLPGVGIDGVPEPAWMRFRLHKTPHCVARRAAPTTHLTLVSPPALHRDLLRMQDRYQRVMHRLACRFLFFHALSTVVGLTCKTRAVSRLPLAFMAM